jgi:hypothetical protein
MSTDAFCGLSIWGAGHSGGGAIANTCSSLRAASPGVVGRLTKIAQPEVAAVIARAAKANKNGKVRVRVFMDGEDTRTHRRAEMPSRRESGSMRA